ncbi:class I SAM-dependent methyltransferase [Jatrophihabitans telluris]|uniref:Class I SAM-dependent methyltransferase n=1 Tax=Jatrophihabitans telluris TaxID=2038343 RepID=A0ABY4QWX9_9ACTN|nr:class I SAM-dependent methyltransferase [Jatrophihabitans telluris]UQX88181.1 class I SAM-dependent methyltransferase [Jatrophihabitans telluris]
MAGDNVGNAGILAVTKREYVRATRALRTGLTSLHLLSPQPPSPERRVRHWLYSLLYIHDSDGLISLDVPWWTYPAIGTVEDWIAQHEGPVRVFEYGSGASTVWLSKRAAEVHSVEHHEGFASIMADRLRTLDNVDLAVVPGVPSANPKTPSHKEGAHGLDFTDYVNAIERPGGRFDLIVIDGRAREACLAAAVDYLQPDGLVVYDNSWRRRYRRAIAASPLKARRFRGIAPSLPYPDETSLLSVG